MFRSVVLACLLAGVLGLRKTSREAESAREGGFKIKTDTNKGVCAQHVRQRDLPIYFPLLCTGNVRDLRFRAKARGWANPKLRLSIGTVKGDGKSWINKGSRTFPTYPAVRTWTSKHGSLPAGLHVLKYSGDRLEFRWLEVEGNGGSCSFESAPGYNSRSWTNDGIDVIYRVIGPNRDFPAFYKRQLHFTHETFGRNADNSISSTVLSNGAWEWFYQYSKQQQSKDEWLSRKLRDGDMYDEANKKPYMKVSLGRLPGRGGENMTVCEPCNTVSNLAFHEAAVYTTCKNFPYKRDELATLMAGFSALAAGSSFFHASATRVGQVADVFTMKLIMYQFHQLMVKKVLAVTSKTLTSAERKTIFTVDTNAGYAATKAKELTRLFRQPYTLTNWKSGVDNLGLPGYMLTIITSVVTFTESLRGNWPIPGLEQAVNSLIDVLMGSLGGRDVDYVKTKFRPAIRKAFSGAKFCGDRTKLIGRFLKFTVTFVDALMFQEEKIQTPKIIRDMLGWLDKLGISSNNLADMKSIWDIYNGQKGMCDRRSAHAKWHEKAADGFMHLQNVASLLIDKVKQRC